MVVETRTLVREGPLCDWLIDTAADNPMIRFQVAEREQQCFCYVIQIWWGEKFCVPVMIHDHESKLDANYGWWYFLHTLHFSVIKFNTWNRNFYRLIYRLFFRALTRYGTPATGLSIHWMKIKKKTNLILGTIEAMATATVDTCFNYLWRLGEVTENIYPAAPAWRLTFP